MTEDDAKTKLCCEGGCGRVTRDTESGEVRRLCVGSDCMGWRWDEESDTDGYCGRAGTP